MIENIPRSVQRCISASAKDVAASMKETGNVRNKDLNAFASSLEKFMLGMVGSSFPTTRGEWLDKTAAPVAPEDASAVRVKQEKETFHNWVKDNATKEMYETHIGAVDALANVLRQQYDNDTTGQFAKNFPDLVRMLESGAPAAPMSTDKPADISKPVEPKAPPEKSDSVPGDLQALLDEKLDDAGSDIPKKEDKKDDKPKGDKKEETPEGYTGGIFNKPNRGPAAAGSPTPKLQNMDEFNTPVEKLAEEKPEAATGHKI